MPDPAAVARRELDPVGHLEAVALGAFWDNCAAYRDAEHITDAVRGATRAVLAALQDAGWRSPAQHPGAAE